jgi:transcriptional antiterminator NusG
LRDEKLKEKIQKYIANSKDLYVLGEEVTVINGPFSTFRGKIQSIDYEKDKIKLEVSIFGRATIVDLTLADISK